MSLAIGTILSPVPEYMKPEYLTINLLEFLHTWIPDYLTIWLSDYLTIWLSDYLTTWISEYLKTWIPKYLTTLIPEYLTTSIPDYLTNWLYDYLNTWTIWIPDYLTNLKTWFPKYLTIPQPDYPTSFVCHYSSSQYNFPTRLRDPWSHRGAAEPEPQRRVVWDYLPGDYLAMGYWPTGQRINVPRPLFSLSTKGASVFCMLLLSASVTLLWYNWATCIIVWNKLLTNYRSWFH